MTETEQNLKNLPQTNQKQHQQSNEEQEQEVSSYQRYSLVEEDIDYGDDPEEQTYLIRLKEQRKRIEELTQLLKGYKYKYEEQVSKSKSLEAQISKLKIQNISSYRYEQINSSLETYQTQNTELKEIAQMLRRENIDLSNELNSKIGKMEKDFYNQRKKDQGKIQNLNEKLIDKQEENEKLQKELRRKEKEINEINQSFSSKLKKLSQQSEEKIIIQQKKIEKYEQKLQSNQLSQLQQNLSELQRINSKLKQQNYGLKAQLQQRQAEFSSQIDKWKVKFNRLKKRFDDKDREYDQLKANLSKIEREHKDNSSQKEELMNTTSKIRSEFTSKITIIQNSFNSQRKTLKATIEKHQKNIEGLMFIKKQYEDRIKELQSFLRRKQEAQRHRKQVLKSEMKQIDRLQRAIDKIVE